MKRIFVAGLFHETHTFLDQQTPLSEFEVRRGAEMAACAGDSSPLGGALAAIESLWYDVIPSADYRGMPSGTVSDEVLDAFWQDVQDAWTDDIDAIYLVLHGAMVTTSHRDVEGEVLRRIRGLPSAAELPLFGVYDLHANFSEEMAEHADCLVAYRTNPHEDARESAVRAVELLDRCLKRGKRPFTVYRHAEIIWAPTRTGTGSDPMASMERVARQIEREHSFIQAVNINAGFAYADTPATGVSFQISTIVDGVCMFLLWELYAAAISFEDALESADQAMDEVLTEVKDNPVDGLTVFVEPSDNIGGGAPGDCTGLLRGMLKYELSNAAVCINDPDAVGSLQSVQIGDTVTLPIGGKGSRFDEGPVSLDVELISLSDGRFELEDKQSHLASMCGDHVDMGPCAVVRHRGMTILLTSRKTPPFDLGQWRSQGIDPAKLDYIAVKAAVAHRKAYDPIAARSYWVDTPGPCRSDLSQFTYQFASNNP